MIFKFAFCDKMYGKEAMTNEKIQYVSSGKENQKHFSLATCHECKIQKKSNKKGKMIMALTCSALKGNLSIYHPESLYMIGKV